MNRTRVAWIASLLSVGCLLALQAGESTGRMSVRLLPKIRERCLATLSKCIRSDDRKSRNTTAFTGHVRCSDCLTMMWPLENSVHDAHVRAACTRIEMSLPAAKR